VVVRCALLALLAALAYAPTLTIPLVEDDYPIIGIAQYCGSARALPGLFQNSELRSRATTYWSVLALWRGFEVRPVAYRAVALLLHIANVLLLYWLATMWAPMRPGAFWAAAFFAVHEGHQEAVMWMAAFPELFLFLFGVAAVALWMRAETHRPAWLWRTAALIALAFAMLSKESAFIVAPLFLLTALGPDWRSRLPRLAPAMALIALGVAWLLVTRDNSSRLSVVSLHAPFWITGPRSFARMMWVWGWISLAALYWRGNRDSRKPVLLAVSWIVIGLAPYCFLMFPYSTQIASRQTYLASAGLGFLFGLAIVHLRRDAPHPRAVVAALLALALVVNVGAIWIRKRAHFLRRAEPTEELIRMARKTNGPIWVRCFPRYPIIAEEAVRLGAGRPASTLVWDEAEAARRGATAVFCFEER